MTADARVRVLAIDLSAPTAPATPCCRMTPVRQGDADRGFAFGGSTSAPAQLADVVGRLVAGTADSDIAPSCASSGSATSVVRGADDEERARIDNTPGLGAASGNEQGVVWQLDPPAARSVLADRRRANAAARDRPRRFRPGRASGQLLVGEAADPRWRAQLDGRR